MKFNYLIAVFALLKVSEAKDISCVRKSTGVECYEQPSLFNIMADETALYSKSEQVLLLNKNQNWFTLIDIKPKNE